MKVMKTRARLAELSHDWALPTRITVEKLCNTLDRTLNEVYAVMSLRDGWESEAVFGWQLPVNVQLKDGSTDTLSVELKMTRNRDENSQWTPWKTHRCELESLLCLWLSTLVDENRDNAQQGLPRVKNYLYVGLASEELITHYRIWIHRMVTPQKVAISSASRYFGYIDRPLDGLATPMLADIDEEHLCVRTEVGLDKLCAHQIYTAFMAYLAMIVTDIHGTGEARALEPTTGLPNLTIPVWMHFRHANSNLALLASIHFECGIGSIEEAYFSIIPAFVAAKILPLAEAGCHKARQTSLIFEQDGNWAEVLKIEIWLGENWGWIGFTPAKISSMFSEREGQLQRLISHLERGGEPNPDAFSTLLAGVWKVLCLRGKPPLTYSPKLVSSIECVGCLIDRYPPGVIRGKVLTVVLQSLQQSDFSKGYMVDVVLRFIDVALKHNHDQEGEILALLVWNATQIPKYIVPNAERGITLRYIVSRNFKAARSLLTIRLNRNLFMDIEQLKQHIEEGGTEIQQDNITPMTLNTDDMKDPSWTYDCSNDTEHRYSALQNSADWISLSYS